MDAPTTIGPAANQRSKQVVDSVLSKRRAAARAGCPEVGNTSVPAFFAGRTVLLTGGTGFLGRLVAELVLRSSPDVAKVYILVRSKRGVSAQDRLRTAFEDPLFDRLRAERPGIVEAKIEAVEGDINEVGLGLSNEDAARLCREVSVFFNLAASVRFTESIENATFTNLRSTREAVALAKAMTKLTVMVHVSTAYTNTKQTVLDERVYTPEHDWRTLIKAVEELPDPSTLTFLGPKLLGPEPNSYTFTKALAEQVVDEARADIPVIIVRPSIVIGTDQDPIPGWIDNLYGFTAFWVLNGKGITRVHTSHPGLFHNLIPGDLVAKTTVLAAWAKGVGLRQRRIQGYDGVEVVNAVVLENMGLTFEEMRYVSNLVRDTAPMPGAVRYPTFRLADTDASFMFWHVTQHLVFGAVLDLLAILVRRKPRMLDIYRKFVVSAINVAYFHKRHFKFIGENQWRLQSLILPSDIQNFCCLSFLNKKDSAQNYVEWATNTIRGVVKYCLREKFDAERDRAHARRLWWVETVIYVILSLILISVCWSFM